MKKLIIVLVNLIIFSFTSCGKNVTDCFNINGIGLDHETVNGKTEIELITKTNSNKEAFLKCIEKELIPNVPAVDRPKKLPVLFVAIHSTGSKANGFPQAYCSLDWWAKNRSWEKFGYDAVVFRDGKICYSLKDAKYFDGFKTPNELVYGVKGVNRIGYNIAYEGGLDENLKSSPNINGIQARVIDSVMTNYIIPKLHPEAIIGGHNDFNRILGNPQKDCPVIDVSEVWPHWPQLAKHKGNLGLSLLAAFLVTIGFGTAAKNIKENLKKDTV